MREAILRIHSLCGLDSCDKAAAMKAVAHGADPERIVEVMELLSDHQREIHSESFIWALASF